MGTIKNQLKQTLDYFKSHNYEISKNELKDKLIGDDYYTDLEIDMVNSLTLINNHYYLDKLNKAKNLANKLAKFEEILMIGVTGSVASKHPLKNDDIDLMIITKNNCLWKTRAKVKWWLIKNKISHRKKNKLEIKDDFCFNLWLEEGYLEVPKAKQNLRNGLDLIMIEVLVDKKNCYQKMLKDNCWAENMVVNGYRRKIKKIKFREIKSKISLLNLGCYWLQFLYMLPTKNKELISLHQAFFHPKAV